MLAPNVTYYVSFPLRIAEIPAVSWNGWCQSPGPFPKFPPQCKPLRPTNSYGATFTPMPMGAALPEMARTPAFTPAVRAKVSRMRST